MRDVLVTDLKAASKYFALLNDMRARRKSITWQAQAQGGHTSPSVVALAALRAMEKSLLVIQYSKTESWRYKAISDRFLKMGSRRVHMSALFGKCLVPKHDRPRDPLEVAMLDKMKMANKDKRVADLRTRILLEIIEKTHHGWYMVFNTLTVANDHYKFVFDRKNRCFEKYIMRINYAIMKSGAERNDKNSSTYFAVVEKGGQAGRLHFHVLHFFKHLPDDCSDPNVRASIPTYRIIDGLRKFWLYGYSTPICVRINSADAFGKLHWRWPVRRNASGEFDAVPASSNIQLARYMAKYITKADDEKAFRWKTRMSRGFGTTIIKRAIQKMPMMVLERHLVTLAAHHHAEALGIQLPMPMLRKMALKELLQRRSSDSKSSKILTIQKSLSKLKARPSIVERLRTLTQASPKSNSQNIGYLEMSTSKGTDIFDALNAFQNELTLHSYNPAEFGSRGFTGYG